MPEPARPPSPADRSPFRPDAPLPGAPDPWHGSTMPEVRPGPPYAMTEMIAAEPAFAERLLTRLRRPGSPAEDLAGAILDCVGGGRSVRFVGCGTSEHGAQGAALIVSDALRTTGHPADLVATQALEAALEPLEAGLLVAVSHEGGTWATNRALAAARADGVATALITVSDRSPGAALADLVVTTDEQDRSWCHTIGYLSPLLVATAVAEHLGGGEAPPVGVRALLAEGSAQEAAAERLASGLAGTGRLLVVGSGADRPAARELALKVEEATYLPATMRDLETVLHGHLPAADGATGLVLLLADRRGHDERLSRAIALLRAAQVIGLRVGAILGAAVEEAVDELVPLGVLRVGEAALPDASAALLGTATPLQLLTERLARARGTNPDTLRRTEARYRDAGAAAE